jgi:hypothetical protein
MMIHVQNTPVAGGAMMASLWLENVAHQAVASTLVLRVAQVEAPKDRDLARVRSHHLKEGPSEHNKQEMKNG